MALGTIPTKSQELGGTNLEEKSRGNQWDYPLVNCHITIENHLVFNR